MTELPSETEVPEIVISEETLDAMGLAERIAETTRADFSDTTETILLRGVLHAMVAQNQMLFATIQFANEGFKDIDLLMKDAQKAFGFSFEGVNHE